MHKQRQKGRSFDSICHAIIVIIAFKFDFLTKANYEHGTDAHQDVDNTRFTQTEQ